MTPEEMREALLKMNDDTWHRRNLDAAYEIYADDIVFQRVPFPPVIGKAANRKADEGMLAAFTEIQSTINEIIIDGDTIAFRWTWEAVHTGAVSLVPATGEHVSMSGYSICQFKDGKIVKQLEY